MKASYDYKVGMKVRIPDSLEYSREHRNVIAYVDEVMDEFVYFTIPGFDGAFYYYYDWEEDAPIPVEESFTIGNTNIREVLITIPEDAKTVVYDKSIDGQKYTITVEKIN